MLHDVVKALYIADYCIEIEFDDGQRGVVDFSDYPKRGGVFEAFNDMKFFRSFCVNEELGILEWPNGIDVAPETLYSKATGSNLPNWMTQDQDGPAL